MGKFIINTFLDLNQTAFKVGKYEYDPNTFFSFFGFSEKKPTVQNLSLKLSTITHIGFYNEKIFNKKNIFVAFKRYGVIKTLTSTYHTDPVYILKLKNCYLKDRCKEISKKLIKDKISNGRVKKVYNIEYQILHP